MAKPAANAWQRVSRKRETPRERLIGSGREQGIDVGGDCDESRVLAHPRRKRSGDRAVAGWHLRVVLTEQA